MIKLSSMPMATAAELLRFLAESESFAATQKQLDGSVTTVEIKVLLRELADELLRTAGAKSSEEGIDLNRVKGVASRTKQVLADLPADEGKALLSAFGLSDSEKNE